jgi:hypothetical protein
MKITLNELRQIVRKIISESLWNRNGENYSEVTFTHNGKYISLGGTFHRNGEIFVDGIDDYVLIDGKNVTDDIYNISDEEAIEKYGIDVYTLEEKAFDALKEDYNDAMEDRAAQNYRDRMDRDRDRDIY